MDNKSVAAVLEEIGTFLELKGENRFKCIAYQNAARTIDGLSTDINALVKTGQLRSVRGIGEGLAEKITELVTTGKLKYYDELRRSIPEGVLEMLRIQGLGPKRVKALWDKLHIKSLAELGRACRDNKLLTLEGFGEKTQDNILKGLAFVKQHEERHLYDDALAAAQAVLDYLRKDKKIHRLEICGSLRRHRETIRDLDILATGTESDEIMRRFTAFPQVERVLAEGGTKSSVLLKTGIQCDIRLVGDAEFPAALLYFTGSKEHNVALRSRAIKRGMKLNEYGLFKGTRRVPCNDEADIYLALGLDWMPPELRENMGEIEAAAEHRLPKLIEPDDIRGTFHTHTTESDGTASLEAMVEGAQRLGYEYLGLSDHSQSASYAHGMSIERLRKQHQAIDRMNTHLTGLRVLKGAEVDILGDGSLDYPDDVLDGFDFVIAAVHTGFNMPREKMTRRIITAMRNPRVTILAHPTGRLLLARDEYQVDLTRVIDAAQELGVVIELSANPHRFDLDWRMCQSVKAQGVKVSINPDAHSVLGIADTVYGVGIARKGWLGKEDVINTMPLKQMLGFLSSHRKRA
ncbi:MAG: DNA polymerase/3'-5' exonuclease PolX [Candidatus Omnitrophica bacterium]|nr:DNA polymerase/3'-5' exonuclease PolX [Candidatus Omnitrophota bacterium]